LGRSDSSIAEMDNKNKVDGLALWVASALSIIMFVAGLNATVDAFGYFGTNRIGYYFSSEREFKANLVRQADYDALIMGDSRIAFTDPKFISTLNYKFLNAGFAAATLPEIYALLRGAQLSTLKLLVLGVRYDDLSQCKAKAQQAPSFWDPLRYSASWSQLEHTVQALHAKFAGVTAGFHKDGTRSSEEKTLRDASLNGQKSSRYWAKVMPRKQVWQGDAVFSDRCLGLLADIRQLALAHGFEFVVVVLPYNNDIIADADWDAWFTAPERKRQFERLRRVIPNFVDFANSELSASQNFWLHDPLHFLPSVGAKIIERAVEQSRNH
jgi:hypothetical protein